MSKRTVPDGTHESAIAAATVIAASGMRVYAISEAAQKMNAEIQSSHQHKGTPRNNQAQNQMFEEAIRRLKKRHSNDSQKD